MEKYDFIKEEIKTLIRNIKKQDYKTGKYLEDNIVFEEKTGNILYIGNELSSLLSRVVVRNSR